MFRWVEDFGRPTYAESTTKCANPTCLAFLQAAPPAKKVKEPPPAVLEKVGSKANVDEASEEELKNIIKEYYDR